MKKEPGTVYLVGAGPGAPEYLTLRAAALLDAADVVVYDNLVGDSIRERFGGQARWIYVGKKAGAHSKTQEEICALLVRLATRHGTVIRLKGGDPFIFGRGGEEAEALFEAGVPFEVVPGITAAQGASAAAGIPLTHRDSNAAVTLVTGHEDPTKPGSTLDYAALARIGHLVFYMGVGRLEHIASELMDRGLDPHTPAAVVRNATLPEQTKVAGSLSDIARLASESGIRPPALVFVGSNAGLGEGLDWFSRRPLFGKAVVVTRARAQASELSARLESLGAAVLESPSIEIRQVTGAEWKRVEKTARDLSRWDWIIFTSVNGAELFWSALRSAGLDARAFAGLSIGVIGPATAAKVEAFGLRPDFLPSRYTTDAAAREIDRAGLEKGHRVLLARAREGNPELARELRRAGARVTDLPLYDTVPVRSGGAELKKRLREGGVDFVTFTSSSTVRYFRDKVGPRNFVAFSRTARYASIGPVTSGTMREFGAEPAMEAGEHTIPGLVSALLDHVAKTRNSKPETRDSP